MKQRVLAFDFGASSGRAIIGEFDGTKIELTEVHRFSNDPVLVNGTLYWDILRLFHEIKQGIVKANLAGGFESIGIDTWGVDFGLIDKEGRLLENPVNYRDGRTDGMVEKLAEIIPLEELYGMTGTQIMQINTLFQLFSLVQNRKDLLERTDRMLFIPDLFNYFLTGVKAAEYTIASTSQLLDANHGWCRELFERLSIPTEMLCDIVKPGEQIGQLSEAICSELGAPAAKVIASASHDTASAVVSVPSLEEDFVFISCGTWSLMGTELKHPIMDKKSKDFNITNEGGYDYTTRYLKNIMGLWLIQETRRQLGRMGQDYSYAQLEQEALKVAPFQSFIDPDAPEFLKPGHIIEDIKEFCKKSGQRVPETVGEIMRCIYESLAMKYRYVFEFLKTSAGKNYAQINVVGGGTKDGFLCQLCANACNTKVVAGPIEATAMGNIAVQLMSLGYIKDLKAARQAVINSFPVKEFKPENTAQWDEAYTTFKKYLL